jgi:hypothetical protein
LGFEIDRNLDELDPNRVLARLIIILRQSAEVRGPVAEIRSVLGSRHLAPVVKSRKL